MCVSPGLTAARTGHKAQRWLLEPESQHQAWRVLMSPESVSPVQGKVHQGRNSATSHRVVVVEEWKAFLSTKNTQS